MKECFRLHISFFCFLSFTKTKTFQTNGTFEREMNYPEITPELFFPPVQLKRAIICLSLGGLILQ